MRLLIAGMAALAAVALASPSFAQDEAQPTPTPTAKPKAGTAAYCNKMKSASQRNACLKNIKVAKAQPTKKAKKPAATPAPKSPDVGQLAPSTPAPAAAPSSGSVAVPPLPSKTI